MTLPRQWPQHAENHRTDAIALLHDARFLHAQLFDLVRDLVKKYPQEGALYRLGELNKTIYDKNVAAATHLREARKP